MCLDQTNAMIPIPRILSPFKVTWPLGSGINFFGNGSSYALNINSCDKFSGTTCLIRKKKQEGITLRVCGVNPCPDGGQGPLWFSANNSQRTTTFALKLSVPLPTTIFHILKKSGQRSCWVSRKWRQRQVMFHRFRPTKRVYGKYCHGRSF